MDNDLKAAYIYRERKMVFQLKSAAGTKRETKSYSPNSVINKRDYVAASNHNLPDCCAFIYTVFFSFCLHQTTAVQDTEFSIRISGYPVARSGFTLMYRKSQVFPTCTMHTYWCNQISDLRLLRVSRIRQYVFAEFFFLRFITLQKVKKNSMMGWIQFPLVSSV